MCHPACVRSGIHLSFWILCVVVGTTRSRNRIHTASIQIYYEFVCVRVLVYIVCILKFVCVCVRMCVLLYVSVCLYFCMSVSMCDVSPGDYVSSYVSTATSPSYQTITGTSFAIGNEAPGQSVSQQITQVCVWGTLLKVCLGCMMLVVLCVF